APRLRAPFDPVWFARLLAGHRDAPEDAGLDPRLAVPDSASGPAGAVRRRQDWGEAPDVAGFLGRQPEREQRAAWTRGARCRVVALLGLGGVGKTMLAARLAHDLAPAFERVSWRSLRNSLPVDEWLGSTIGFIADEPLPPPDGEAAGLSRLLEL